MDNLNWHDQADVWVNEISALDTDQSRNQTYFNAASVAFDAGFLFIRPRNDRKTHAVPASNVVRVEFPPRD